MSTKILYIIGALLVLLFYISFWKDWVIFKWCFGVFSVLAGAVIVIYDPKTDESKRVGYRTIGITLMIVGAFWLLLEIIKRFALRYYI